MDIVDDSVLRFNQIQRFPQIKLTHDENDSNCSICIGDFNKNEIILILPCVHKFHSKCIKTWLSDNNTCPTCRGRVIQNVGIENDDHDTSSEYVEITELLDYPGNIPFPIVNSLDISISSSSDTADEQVSISSDSTGIGGGCTTDLDDSDYRLASDDSVYSNSPVIDISSQSSGDSSSMFIDSGSDHSIVSSDTSEISLEDPNESHNLISSDGSDISFDDVNDTYSDDDRD